MRGPRGGRLLVMAKLTLASRRPRAAREVCWAALLGFAARRRKPGATLRGGCEAWGFLLLRGGGCWVRGQDLNL